jgi:hypothetical protein
VRKRRRKRVKGEELSGEMNSEKEGEKRVLVRVESKVE